MFGYSPYCLNEWVSGLCGKKKRIKCSKCQNQKYVGLDEMTLRKHFTGEETLGLYPIDLEDMCYLVVMDFDKDNWQEEVKTVVSICKESNISCHVEQSRSDDEVVWYGGVDLLAGNCSTDSAIRILSGALSNELYGAL